MPRTRKKSGNHVRDLRRMGRVAWLPGAAVLAGLALACDDNPNRLARFPGAPSPAPDSPSTFTHLTIGGPTAVAPGTTAQLTATAHYSNGSTRDATNDVTWRSSDDAILAVSAGGLAIGRERGEVSVTVVLESRTAIRNEVMVLPPGTFRLSGVVTDGGVPLFGARIAVTSGEGTGQGTSTNAEGRFRLYGAAGEVEIRATKGGYLDGSRRVQVSSHQAFVPVELALIQPRPTIAGTYALTIAAASTCSGLPPEARVRTYTATLYQNGPSAQGTLGGAEFIREPWGSLNRFSGVVGPDVVTFKFAPPWSSFYLPDVVEILQTESSSYLSIVGDAVTTATSSGRSGTLNGVIETLSSTFRRVASCQSSEHRFVLSQ